MVSSLGVLVKIDSGSSYWGPIIRTRHVIDVRQSHRRSWKVYCGGVPPDYDSLIVSSPVYATLTWIPLLWDLGPETWTWNGPCNLGLRSLKVRMSRARLLLGFWRPVLVILCIFAATLTILHTESVTSHGEQDQVSAVSWYQETRKEWDFSWCQKLRTGCTILLVAVLWTTEVHLYCTVVTSSVHLYCTILGRS